MGDMIEQPWASEVIWHCLIVIDFLCVCVCTEHKSYIQTLIHGHMYHTEWTIAEGVPINPTWLPFYVYPIGQHVQRSVQVELQNTFSHCYKSHHAGIKICLLVYKCTCTLADVTPAVLAADVSFILPLMEHLLTV